MRNYGKYMWEILFIILGGILTVGLSIMAVIKGNKQEFETKKYQEESRRLQEETRLLQDKLSEKSDQIISLNEELRRLSDSQANELRRMTKKTPSQVLVSPHFKVHMSEKERQNLFTQISSSQGLKSNIITKSFYEKSGIKSRTLDLLFTSSIKVHLKFTGRNSGKELNVVVEQFPINYTDHVLTSHGRFMLYYDEHFNLMLNGSHITSVLCISNTHSLYDFEDYELQLEVTFSEPTVLDGKVAYALLPEETLVVEPLNFNLRLDNMSGYNFQTDNWKEIKTNLYSTKGSLDLD